MVGEIIGPDLLIVVLLVVLFFGLKRLPELARGLGSAKREYERGLRGDDNTAPAHERRTVGGNDGDTSTAA